ncbi:hypothetical protein EYF80_010060 [Liparis tanakae]|uniref:Uncharacterized protein n=1 Tax=Liparis tanakae TaxID=230148 RepID=A0A4Z2IP98_9TELE|nr:hypothetical protein EYF80_010060 [Liparis tanakae]
MQKQQIQRKLDTHSSICCSDRLEALSETLDSSKHANMGCDRAGPSGDSAPTQERTEDVISSTPSEKQLAPFTSVSSNIQVERPKDTPAVPTHIQSPTAGITEGCVAQKEPQTLGWIGTPATPGRPDVAEGRPKQSQEARRANRQHAEGEDENGGFKANWSSGRRDQAESTCTYTCLTEMPEEEDAAIKADLFKHAWQSEHHLQHLSQMHSGMSEYPPRSPQRTPNNLNSPASGSQSDILNSPQLPLDMNNFGFSQQHWESSSIHHQQVSCDPSVSRCVNAQSADTQNFSQSKSVNLQNQAFPHRDRTQSSITPVQQGHTDAKLTMDSHRSPSVSPDSHSAQVGRAAAGWTGLNKNVLDNNAAPPSEPFTFPEPFDYNDTKDGAPNEDNKYQSFFLSGQLNVFQPVECLFSGVRPVQSCQNHTEDTSSSDDEGKLIIEL